jgi:hypothetical protein
MSLAESLWTVEDILLLTLDGMSGVGTEPLTPQNRILIRALRIDAIAQDQSPGPAPLNQAFLYINPRSYLPSIHPVAGMRLLAPGSLGIQYRGPEGVGPALYRSIRVDATTTVAPEHAIVAGIPAACHFATRNFATRNFAEAQGHTGPHVHQGTIVTKKSLEGKAVTAQQPEDIVFRKEYVSGLAPATGRASRAGETEPFGVEWLDHR